MPYLTLSDGIKLYYEDYGSGESLIFSHGLGSFHNANKNFYDMFKDDYNVIIYDQRGHAASKSKIHMNVNRLGQDINEIIELLDLKEVTLIGHSMGAASIYSYVNQFACKDLKRIVASDMSPYIRNNGWNGGIAQGKWTDGDFMQDMDRFFDDVGYGAFYIYDNIMNPNPSNMAYDAQKSKSRDFGNGIEPLTMASFWYSLFRTDLRPAIDKITVPLLYIMPEYPLYSMDAVDYIKNHVKGDFVLANDFPGTTHAIWSEKTQEVAETVKTFLENY